MAHHPRHRHLPPEIEEAAPLLARGDGQFIEPPQPRCPTCRWCDLSNNMLHCRYNPPAVDVHRPGLSYWPRVTENDYCSRWGSNGGDT